MDCADNSSKICIVDAIIYIDDSLSRLVLTMDRVLEQSFPFWVLNFRQDIVQIFQIYFNLGRLGREILDEILGYGECQFKRFARLLSTSFFAILVKKEEGDWRAVWQNEIEHHCFILG